MSAPERTSLPALIDRSRTRLAEARSSAEVLEAKAIAESALHFARITRAANATHADCLRMIVRAEMRLATEIDAGQERGEVARADGSTHHRPAEGVRSPDTLPPATLDDLGFDRRRVAEWRDTRDAGEEVVEEAIEQALSEDRAPRKEDIRRAVEEAKAKRRERIDTRNAEIARQSVAPPQKRYATIVLDPPWPIERIERDARPNQAGFDYPTMSLDQIGQLPIREWAEPPTHVFCWTTQRFLRGTFDIMEQWGVRPIFTMVWHKPGGFQPYNLPQYNAEFIIYGRIGSAVFSETKRFSTCFEAPRREHSRKPDEFYELVSRVCPENRLDVFSREPRAGFDQYGNEAARFEGAA